MRDEARRLSALSPLLMIAALTVGMAEPRFHLMSSCNYAPCTLPVIALIVAIEDLPEKSTPARARVEASLATSRRSVDCSVRGGVEPKFPQRRSHGIPISDDSNSSETLQKNAEMTRSLDVRRSLADQSIDCPRLLSRALTRSTTEEFTTISIQTALSWCTCTCGLCRRCTCTCGLCRTCDAARPHDALRYVGALRARQPIASIAWRSFNIAAFAARCGALTRSLDSRHESKSNHSRSRVE